MGIYEDSVDSKTSQKSSKRNRWNPSQVCQEDRNFAIVDILDITDPTVKQFEAAQFGSPSANTGPGVCRSTHQLFVTNGVMAVEWLVEQLVQLANDKGPFSLLRFHGHGLPACQFVYGDDMVPGLLESYKARPDPKRMDLFKFLAETEQRNPRSSKTISYWNLNRVYGSLLKLTSCFAPGAEVWLMGCSVGNGLEGRELMNRLALLWGVSVKAGINIQYATSLFSKSGYKYVNYVHEGPVVTGRPTLNPFKR